MPRGRKLHKQEVEPVQYPILMQIYGGKWQAHGDGWAVAGDTEQEAQANYEKAVQRHQEILALPEYYLQKQIMPEEKDKEETTS